ncbi:MAG TPA: ABC transporter permease [Anaerolineaceae bacterium]|nr:ABC transporter permease [Anaerolineaceae bacterium]
MASLKTFSRKYSRWFLPASFLMALVLWQGLIWLGGSRVSAFYLPSPMRVLGRFGQELADGTLLSNTAATLLEVILGLLLGSSLATVIGYGLAKSPALERLLSPYLIASQAIPVVAIAPLLVIWFGPGLFSKVLICALIVFFPILVNTVVGMRAVSQNLRDLMGSLYATPAQTLRYLEIPAALPVLLAGLRVGATLSVIGAVVGEFVGSDRGLGFLVNVARGQYDTTLVFVSVLTLIALALLLYGAVVLVEKRLLKWNA